MQFYFFSLEYDPSWSNEKDLHVAINDSITSAEQLAGSLVGMKRKRSV
jgi:hypothetical protein